MSKTKIEWTDMTWNPIIGCHKISPGCDNCYAEKMANRIAHMNNYAGEMYRKVIDIDGKWSWETHLADADMLFPSMIKKTKRIFVGSMTDIFLHSQSEQGRLDVARLFGVMQRNPQHIFQLLTKRPHEMKIFIDDGMRVLKEMGGFFGEFPLPNVWLGVTVCNQKEADFNIPILLDTPAAVRFVSIEPMLGKVNLFDVSGWKDAARWWGKKINIDWVIVGGESGPKARPMYPEHVEALWKQCKDNKVPFFFKSWGSYWMKGAHKEVVPMWELSNDEWAAKCGYDKGFHNCKEFPDGTKK